MVLDFSDLAQAPQVPAAKPKTLDFTDISQPQKKPVDAFNPQKDLAAIANAPGIAQIGQAGRAIGQTVGNLAKGPGLTPMGKGIVHAVTHPFSWAWHTVQGALDSTHQAIIKSLTNGQGFQQALIMSGVDSQAARIGAAIFNGATDPSNILMAPGLIGKGVGVASTIGRAVLDVGKASGLGRGTAAVAARAAQVMSEGRFTGPVVRQLSDSFARASEKSHAMLEAAKLATNKFHGTPKELPDIVREWRGNLYNAGGESMQLASEMHNINLSHGDRILLDHALQGLVPESAIPDRLAATYQRWSELRDNTTQVGLTHNIINEARDHYLMGLYGPEDMAKIKAKSLVKTAEPTDIESRFGIQPPRVGPGSRGSLAEQQVREHQILEGTPESGPRSAFGKQILPTRGLRGVVSRSALPKTYADTEAAKRAGLHPIEDPAIKIPAHHLGFGIIAANVQFYKKIAALGEPWVGKLDSPALAGQAGKYTPMAKLIGDQAAVKYKMDGLWVHPRVAEVVKDALKGAGNYADEMSIWGKALNLSDLGMRRIIFANPGVHGANIWKAAALEHGAKVFDPKFYQKWHGMADDAWRMGEVTRRRLAAGGQLTSGVGRYLVNIMDRIVSTGPAGESLFGSGLSWSEITKLARAESTRAAQKGAGHVGQAMTFERALNDEILWNTWDAGFRNMAFMDGLESGMTEKEAAKFADDVLNRYAKEDYSEVDKALNQVIFVYAWTRGRAQFFAEMAKAYGPGEDAVTKKWRAMATRWAVANVVAPHLYRSLHDKATLGLEGARLPISQRTTPSGHQVQVYAKPSGWYNDAFEFLQNPFVFGLYRLKPSLMMGAKLIADMSTAALRGQNVESAVGSSISQSLPRISPAGLTQALQPGLSMGERALPFVGVPITGAPEAENPRMQMWQKIEEGDFFGAGQLAKQAGMPYAMTLSEIPYTGRAAWRKGFDSRVPGMPIFRGPSLPRIP